MWNFFLMISTSLFKFYTVNKPSEYRRRYMTYDLLVLCVTSKNKTTTKIKCLLQSLILVSKAMDIKVKCHWIPRKLIGFLTITQAAWSKRDNHTTTIIKGLYMLILSKSGYVGHNIKPLKSLFLIWNFSQ